MSNEPHEPTGEARLDLESLAAYLDGKLSPAERAEVEHVLAVSAEAREILAEAVKMQEDLDGDADEEEPLVGVRDGAGTKARAPRGRSWLIPTLAAAAVVAVSLFVLRPGAPAGSGLWGTDRLLRDAPGVVRDGWDQHPWTVSRSNGVTLPVDRSAFRVGVRWTDALVAWQSGRSEEAAEHFAAVGVILDGVPLASPASRMTAELTAAVIAGRSVSETDALLRDGRERLDALLPSGYLALGAWVESVRLAANAGAVAWVSDPATRDELARIPVDGLPDAAAATLDEVRAALNGDVTPESLPPLSEALDRLLTHLGG